MFSVFRILIVCLWLGVGSAYAAIEVHQFDTPQQEAQYRALIADFRCPTCQNQNLAGSDAPIAQDLKQKTYEMVKEGKSDKEIREYMYDRYGDFIRYTPPVRPSTWILWFFPPILLILLVLGWLYKSNRPKKLSEKAAGLSESEQARLDKIISEFDHATSTIPPNTSTHSRNTP